MAGAQDGNKLPWKRAHRVVSSGEPLTRDQIRRIRKGADVDVFDAPSLDHLLAVAKDVKELWVRSSKRVDISALSKLTSLTSLSLELRGRGGQPVDLAGLTELRNVGLVSAESVRVGGSAIASPKLEVLSVWSPTPDLFEQYRTSPRSLRLVFAQGMSCLPPISTPQSVVRLMYQSVPELDLADIGRFRSLETLIIQDAKSLIGFRGLLSVPGLRHLQLGNIGAVDEPAALAELSLSSFTEWNERAHDQQIWWMPDLQLLIDRGWVDSQGWYDHRVAYEARWAKLTGLPIPRHFS